MRKKEIALLVSAVAGIVGNMVGLYVINEQDKQKEKLYKFGTSLSEVLAVYEQYVPDVIIYEMHEKVQWDAITREFNG